MRLPSFLHLDNSVSQGSLPFDQVSLTLISMEVPLVIRVEWAGLFVIGAATTVLSSQT